VTSVAATSTGVSVTGISANVALDSGFSAAINYSMMDIDLVNGDGNALGHWRELHVRRDHRARQLR
jgi:hypothetical protein